MTSANPALHHGRAIYPELQSIDPKVDEHDMAIFRRVTNTTLSEEQERIITCPPQTFPRQRTVLAVHWHPEHVPLPLIEKRIEAMYPNREQDLIIPTQHNEILTRNGYAGVEVDCYSRGFNRKVQLLLHFRAERVAGPEADVLKAMIEHTRKYRASQLFEFLACLAEPAFAERRQAAAEDTAANEHLVSFVAIYAAKIRNLLEAEIHTLDAGMIKNKLVRDFFDSLRDTYDPRLIQKAQIYLKAVKERVKSGFSLKYFYRTSEIIEEARALGGGVIVPHPEQFWPILLADYDVCGYEVWNPQSQEYTDFLINAVNRQNRTRRAGSRPMLILMGDDTHMGEKIRPGADPTSEKATREIGRQAAWDDLSISKSLIVANIDRGKVIEEYKARLDG